ncbi:hypothetical protein Ddep01_01017 [Deinococcus depolymerans]
MELLFAVLAIAVPLLTVPVLYPARAEQSQPQE